jgi:hypothetical protein
MRLLQWYGLSAVSKTCGSNRDSPAGKKAWLATLLVLYLCRAREYTAEASRDGGQKGSGAASIVSEESPLVCQAHGFEQKPHDSSHNTQEHILAGDWESIDPVVLSKSIAALKERGAHRCWHKHSTFLEHLLGVHNILKLWNQGTTIARVGLFHSAYSNSYVNLALFDPDLERETMKELIGPEAEDLVYLFCTINRQEVVVDTLLKQGFIPQEGLTVPHLRHKHERVFLSAETLRLLVVFTMADIADQYFGWQDQLFGGGGQDGSMIIPGQDIPHRHESTALWPGVSMPGLWMSYLSDLAKVARTFRDDWWQEAGALPAPPVFSKGTQHLTVKKEVEARDLYWSVVSLQVQDPQQVADTLRACIGKNPFSFEPLVLLAQILLHQNDFDDALHIAGQAIELQQQWGTAWDKRLSFGAWHAWTLVLYQRAEDRLPWPTNSWDVNNLGLVR